MKRIYCYISVGAVIAALNCLGESSENSEKLSRMLQQSTLSLLKEGNVRFAAGKSIHPNQETGRRVELAAAGQEPLATILACSDSRDPVEFIFDRGIGDLFVVRVAGNVAGLSELATMEYGVTHLGTPVLVVMGHSKCGAVTAAVKGGELHGHLPSLISLIKPAADKARVISPGDEAVPKAIELNVWQQVENILTRSTLIREYVVAGKVQVVGAVYDIASGNIQWLGQHPEMDRLLGKAVAGKEISSTHDAGEHDVNPDSHTPAPVKVEATPIAKRELPQQATSHSAPAHAPISTSVSEDDLLLEAVARGRR